MNDRLQKLIDAIGATQAADALSEEMDQSPALWPSDWERIRATAACLPWLLELQICALTGCTPD